MKRKPVLILLIALTAACSDYGTSGVEPAVPQHRTLKIRWTTPHTTDAAVRLTIRGPDVADITAVHAQYISFSRVIEGGRSIVVFGELGSGDLVSFAVRDGVYPEQFVLTLEQVAGTTDELRADLEGYRMAVVPASSP